MTTLFLDRRDALIDSEARTLLVRTPDGDLTRLPLAHVERVVLRAPARLTTAAIAAIAEADAGLLVLSGRRSEPVATILGRPHADAAIRLGQMRLALDPVSRLAVARVIVRRKLLAQARTLSAALARRPDRRLPLSRGLAALRDTLATLRLRPPPDAATLSGLEGAAAAAHFAALAALFPPSLAFSGRNRRPPRDPVNAVLSLAYTLAHAEAVREAQLAGLDPAIGFLHALAPGRASLACDLVEPMRGPIDHFVWRLFAEETLRKPHFTRDGEAVLLGKAGRLAFYTAWEAAAAPLRRALRRGLRPLVAACRQAAADLPWEKGDAAEPAS
ncbi:CRISPR-associated endonuclease Cas1 [Elioraea thermophila]|uniref:CRISPR-associated endonuclease Cas1 n=1 Tax=Elioraea thermophila TaxID=2185104 RepID=UPI000DF26FCE|nr:CRISPR-associated endonuclease Cas1 [Elioraea thermophila]